MFGPRPRDYGYSVPKKVKKGAMKSALSMKVSENKVYVVNEFTVPVIKTKQFNGIISSFKLRKVLVVIPEKDVNLELSARNIPNVKVIKADGINVYDVMKYDALMLHKGAVEKIEGVLSV